MGWMSWEIFRCNIDCKDDPANCISENLYKAQADAMVSEGFAAHGYNSIRAPRSRSRNQSVGSASCPSSVSLLPCLAVIMCLCSLVGRYG
jgi:hypothetical protein